MNSQNLPNDRTREIFVARPKHTLFFFDYSQIELRIAAVYLNDELWLKGYQQPDYDIHKETSKIIFGREHQNKEERKFSKNFNFAILYGAGVPRITRMLIELFGGTKEEWESKAREMIQRFRQAHPNLTKYLRIAEDKLISDRQKRNYKYVGYLKNKYDRRYCLPYFLVYKWLEYLTSGDATADLLKLKFCEVAEHLIEHKLKASVIMLTHDELICEIADCSNQKDTVENVARIMEDVEKVKGIIPIKVDVEYGRDCLNKKVWEGTNEFACSNRQ